MPRTQCGRMAAALLAFGVLAAACGGGGGEDDAGESTTTTSTTSTSSTTTTTLPDGPVAPLTGVQVDEDSPLLEQAAIVVKISNNSTVQDNWQGIEQADVVIEERIESEATRFAVVFHSTLPESVGPIRSGRTSDVDLLANLGTPILVYSGANPSVTSQLQGLQRDELVKLVVDRATNVDLVRDNDYRRPDNLFSNLVEIEEKYREDAGTAVPLFEYRDERSSERTAGTPSEGVTVTGANIVSFVWDQGLGWVRVQDGEIHQSLAGDPFVFDNIVLLEVAYTPSPFAPGSVDAQTTGTGPLNILIDGRRFEGTWSRDAATDPYTFLDADGDPLRLDPGQTWMTLVPAGTYEFTVDAEIAALLDDVDE